MSASYSLESRWRLPVPPQRAWAELVRALEPGTGLRWWPGVTLPMAPRRLLPGERMTVVVRSPLAYRLRMRLELTEVDRGRAIAARSDGDLQGSGRVEIRADGGVGTVVVFQWDVETRRAWMNATAWALRPAFERAHARVMRHGEQGLRAALASV